MATTAIAVTLDDGLLALVRDAAGETPVPQWIAKACQARLLRDNVRDLRRWESEHRGEGASSRGLADSGV
ncbi:hypothetical protein ACWIGW_44020 [Nocardia brasiliensis]|uniref:hypothetical protein n=1 Tax=Streptomyces sp. NPDC056056 TaxID=3345698 RepID=UPI0035D99191